MRLKLVALTLLSSLLFPLALPNEILLQGNAFLGLFCLSFFFWAVYESPSFRFAAVLGMLFGGITTLLANIWLKNFNEYALYTLGMTTLGYVGYNALLACFIRGFSLIRPALRPFLSALLFALYDFLKSTGFVASPYSLIAYPVHDILPFIQFVDITGLWGLSFVCALFSSLLAEAFSLRFGFAARGIGDALRRRALDLRRKGLFALALAAIAFLYGGVRLAAGFRSDKTLLAVLVQQNVDPWRGDRARAGLRAAQDLSFRGIEAAVDKYRRLPDLIVWSETALRYPIDIRTEFPFRSDPGYRQEFPGLFEQFQTATLTGAPVVSEKKRRFHNAAILITKEGRVPAMYAKQHPVPFVEGIPFMEIDFVRDFFENNLGLSNFWLMGDRPVVFSVPVKGGKTVRFGVPICFEDMFADICREMANSGAEALINITNDSWSQMKSALTQHTAAARFRAIETRRPLLRSTNAGLTCVIDPSGAVVSGLPLFEPGQLLVEVPVSSQPPVTFYALAGDYFPYLIAAYLIAVLCLNAFGAAAERLYAKIKAMMGKHRRPGRA